MLKNIAFNYAAQKLFNIPVIPNLYIDQASGTFDDLDNFYFIAVTGTTTGGTTFQPNSYYLGKFTNVSTLTTTPSVTYYTLINFSGANCSGFSANLGTAVSTTGPNAGTGIQDIAYSNFHRSVFLYEAYQSPANSGNYVGQLFSINPATGVATCYTSTTTFGAANNEVAGLFATASGNLRVFTTNGDVYRTTLTNDFTSTLTRIGASGITPNVNSQLRGDLASCNVGPTSLPASALPPSIVVGAPNQIVAYPNPVKGITTIAVGQSLNNATVKLLSPTGTVIAEKSGVFGLTFQMDLTGKPSGMYMVEVIQGGTQQIVKIIKE